MGPSSSTSSSSGLPWAFVCALLVIVGVEVGLRAASLPGLSPYSWGIGEYDAAAARLRDDGPPAVMVLGTSRAREALDVPRMTATLGMQVGNYGLSGARAAEALAVFRCAARNGRPRLVLVGLEPRLLQGRREFLDRQARFWSWPEAWERRSRDDADALWSITARAHLARLLRAFRDRDRLCGVLAGDVDPRIPVHNPIDGGFTLFQQSSPDVSLVTRPIDDAWVETHLERVAEDGDYRITSERVASLRTILRMCRDASIDVVLFEIPISRAVERHLPMGTLETFQRAAQRLAREEQVRYIELRALGLVFMDDDFYDPSHLNLRGARRFTDALASALR